MQITTAKVDDGVIRIDGESFPDGTSVTLLALDGDETFELNAAQEAELLAAIAEADRSDFVDPDQVLKQIRRS